MDKHMLVLLVIMAITLYYSRAMDYLSYRKTCISMVTVIMTCFSGFRSWWMGDLIKYYTLYTQCNGENWVSRVFDDYANIGIRLFFRIAGALGISYDVCIFLIAALSAVTLSIVVFHYSPSPYWSYLMYFAMGIYLFTYSGLKQTIAMALLMLALMGILEDNPRKFLKWTLIAGIFHMPALIFLPAYLIAKKKINFSYFLILAAAIACVFLFRDQIIELFSAAYYEEESKFEAKKVLGGRAVIMILILLVAAFLRPPQTGDRYYRQVYNLMVMAAMIQTFSVYDNVFTRLADYYYQFVVLFMPLMLETGTHQLKMNRGMRYRVRSFDRNTYLLLSLGITAMALYVYSSTLSGSKVFLDSYKFFWEIDPYALYGQ